MSKGTLLVSQSGGPSPVVNASLAGVIAAARAAGYARVLGLVHAVEGALHDQTVDLSGISDANLARLAATPGAALGSSRYILQAADIEHFLDFLRRKQISSYVAIGGNGTMAACQVLALAARQAGQATNIVGAPKTIDNDLAGTDHSPGYGSAARFCAQVTQDISLDLEAMQRFDDVHILECLGRDAGWITAASILGKNSDQDAPHLVYLPEVPFIESRFLEDVQAVHDRLGRVMVTVGEGLRTPAGHYVGQPYNDYWGIDRNNNQQVTLTAGVAAYLAQIVRAQLKLQTRSFRPLFAGRVSSACASTVDRAEALAVGEFAVRCLAEGADQVMVSIRRVADSPYQAAYETVELASVVANSHPFPPAYIHPAGNMILPTLKTYLDPLIGAALHEPLRLHTFQ